MTAQRERIASLKRQLKAAKSDGDSKTVRTLDALISAEEQVLRKSREPGESQTVADLLTDQEDPEQETCDDQGTSQSPS